MPSLKAVARMIARLSVLATPFLAAGRVDWWQGWLLTGLFLGTFAVNLALMAKFNPELIRLRMEPIQPERGFDRLFVAGGFLLFLLALIIGGLDTGRYLWSRMDPAWTLLGVVLFLAGMIPISWSLMTNRFLSPTVRIQTDRGHAVVATGPYRIVRHPMYSGLLVVYLATPFLLGSWWAFIPAWLLAALLVFRTAKEDATLQSELDGYKEFTRQTPYRLIAHVW